MADANKILSQLQIGFKRIGSLNPEDITHKEAVYNYLKSKPSLIKTLSTDVEKAFLKYSIEQDYKLFLQLDKAQYDEDMANGFLYGMLTRSNGRTKELNDQFICRSFDESLVLNVLYETHDGEQIFYYDNQLEVPTFLIANIQFAFKVNSVLKLFEKLDTSLSMIGFNTVNNELIKWINEAYREAISKFIDDNKLDVYKISGLYGEIEKELSNSLNKILEGSGLSVYAVNVNKISIPENTYKILERQSLELVNVKNKRNNELEYEKLSLQNYARKAEVHAQNPGFELTLTEAEKDFALNRYITKHDVDTNKVRKEIESSTNELADRKVKVADTKIEKVADVIDSVKKINPKIIIAILAGFVGLALIVRLINMLRYGAGGPYVVVILSILVGAAYFGIRFYKNKKEK